MTPGAAAARLEAAMQAAQEAWRASLAESAEQLRQEAHDTIGTAGGPDGSWAPLAASTLAEKAADGHRGRVSDPDTLYATGQLRESFVVDASDPDAPTVTSSDPVLQLHEHGTARMPPRPVLQPLATTHGEDAARQAGAAAVEAIRRALGR